MSPKHKRDDLPTIEEILQMLRDSAITGEGRTKNVNTGEMVEGKEAFEQQQFMLDALDHVGGKKILFYCVECGADGDAETMRTCHCGNFVHKTCWSAEGCDHEIPDFVKDE